MTAAPLLGIGSAIRGWTPLVCLSLGVPLIAVASAATNLFACRESIPAWWIAWGLIFAFFGAMKWLTWRRTSAPDVSPWRRIGYLFFWPGLDAPAFLRGTAARDAPVDPREGVVALGKLFLGAALFWGAARWVPSDWPLVQGWAGLAGLAIGLLGGASHFASWLWRAAAWKRNRSWTRRSALVALRSFGDAAGTVRSTTSSAASFTARSPNASARRLR